MAGPGGGPGTRTRCTRPDAVCRGGGLGRGCLCRGSGAVTRDRGSATVWAALAATTMCVVFAAVLALGQAMAARHRAAAAADLAALAAADHTLLGEADACGRAVAVAEAQGAEVARCALRGDIADVTARARFGPYTPAIRARAGPPLPPPESLPDPPASPVPPPIPPPLPAARP
ncbi:Rv3654c family TadE-like protein [Streptomyces sp. NPDC088725]|uniref:Rv3654c family TadE-like protein n=1 Tax=Streptomyces sp. NPDC088725 TaxID=3365873 RepID=UPI0038065F53